MWAAFLLILPTLFIAYRIHDLEDTANDSVYVDALASTGLYVVDGGADDSGKDLVDTRSVDFCRTQLGGKGIDVDTGGDWVFTEVPPPEAQPDHEQRVCTCACTGLDCFECVGRDIGGTAAKPICTGTDKCQQGETESPDYCQKTTTIHDPCKPLKGKLSKDAYGALICKGEPCPQPPIESPVVVTLVGTCACDYKIECPPWSDTLELHDTIISADSLQCVYRRERHHTQAPATCKHPGVMTPAVSGGCESRIPCPPGPVTILPGHLACGPQTDEYIELMIIGLQDVAKTVVDNAKLLSCKTTCVSVWAKIAECAGLAHTLGQEKGWEMCIGTGAIHGVEQIDFSKKMVVDPDYNHYTTRLKNNTVKVWKLANKRDVLPCTSVFQSSTNFKGSWADVVQATMKASKEHYVRLTGTYVDQPRGRLSCRKAYCMAAAKRGTSLSQCLEDCAS